MINIYINLEGKYGKRWFHIYVVHIKFISGGYLDLYYYVHEKIACCYSCTNSKTTVDG